jgi:hypothetical protein
MALFTKLWKTSLSWDRAYRLHAKMVELVDTLVSEASAARLGGSSPPLRICGYSIGH